MSDLVILDAMSKKKIRTVTVHARIPESDVAEIDRMADVELVSRSNMIARVVREWVKMRQRSPKKLR